jgi:hypothetical protein
MSAFLSDQTVATPLLLKTEYCRLAVIVDVACDGSIQFMAQVRQKHMTFLSLP